MTKSDMSDFGDDIDDELLALATEDSDKKRKRKQPSGAGGSSSGNTGGGSKRRKADMSRSSYDTPESEEERDNRDPYPLEGKYKDEEDRRWLMSLPEIERERILADRADQKQQLEDEKILSQMVREQRGAVSTNGEEDRVSAAAKRQHTARGSTKEKTKKLDELKAKRKAKDEKKKSRQLSPKRERSSSPMDMDISDEESEDGQITKYDEEEEKERKWLDKLNGGSRKAEEEGDKPAELEDIMKCRITRDQLIKYCLAPWFQDYVQGGYVRFLVGHENGQSVYRICEISNLAADLVKPYQIDDRTMNQALELKVGNSARVFTMEKVSNGLLTEKEFGWLRGALMTEKINLPTKKQLEKKAEQMERLIKQPVTESDINAMLARKSQLSRMKSAAHITMERSRLTQARTLAERRRDFAEVAEIDNKLAELNASTESSVQPQIVVSDAEDKLAKVNERNRKANLEAIRKAELADAERKRKERKMAMQSGGAGGDMRPSTPHDPSARLKTVPRVFAAATPTGSRPGTPGVSTPKLGPTPAAKTEAARQVSPLPLSAPFMEVEVDLGDF